MFDDCHFETICHDLDDGLLILQDGCSVYANRALAAMVGSTAAQMLAVRADAYLEMDLDPEVRRPLYTAEGGGRHREDRVALART